MKKKKFKLSLSLPHFDSILFSCLPLQLFLSFLSVAMFLSQEKVPLKVTQPVRERVVRVRQGEQATERRWQETLCRASERATFFNLVPLSSPPFSPACPPCPPFFPRGKAREQHSFWRRVDECTKRGPQMGEQNAHLAVYFLIASAFVSTRVVVVDFKSNDLFGAHFYRLAAQSL